MQLNLKISLNLSSSDMYTDPSLVKVTCKTTTTSFSFQHCMISYHIELNVYYLVMPGHPTHMMKRSRQKTRAKWGERAMG